MSHPKFAPEWIEHDGTECPFRIGDRVCAMNFSGVVQEYDIDFWHVTPNPTPMRDEDGGWANWWSGWFWAVNKYPPHTRESWVARYKIVGVAADEEMERRAGASSDVIPTEHVNCRCVVRPIAGGSL